jgi:CheY-like chemotaxis protein
LLAKLTVLTLRSAESRRPENAMNTVSRRVVLLYAAFFTVFCLAVFGFWFFGGHLFSVLLQRSKAYTPPPFLSWLSLASSLSIAVAFSFMPFSLFRIVRGRSDVPFGGVVLCIAGFLFLCGLGAFIGLLTVWFQGPMVVWSLVLVRLAAALLSVATLFILRALVPRILEIPTRAQWLSVNNELVRAEAQAEAKNKLLAVLSHELRTPLAPLMATLTELEHEIAPYKISGANESVAVIRKNLDREARLITDLLDRLEIPASEPEPVPPSKKYPRPLRLLLVEDHADTLRIFGRILRRKGFDVQEASSVSEAINSSRPGDLLLSDIALPDGDGRDLMRKLRQRGIPGIAITGFGTAKDREEYRRAGFAEALIKPVDVEELLVAIGRVTETNGA